MDRVSRPLLGVLVATVAVFALWVVALKPSSSSKSGGSGGVGQYQPAINAAHAAVAQANKASGAQASASVGASTGGAAPTSSTPAPTSSPAAPTSRTAAPTSTTAAPKITTPATATPAAPHHAAAHSKSATTTARAHHASRPAVKAPVTLTADQRQQLVDQALQANKVLALLFYNPAASDDREVARELSAIPVKSGHVVKVAVPITELSRYASITKNVQVGQAPTLMVVDHGHEALTIVGFTDSFEISQRIQDALAS
jgi:hypothetical protein